MSYKIGDIITGIYSPEVADWCNQNKCVIVEIEPDNGERRFEIKSCEAPLMAVIDELRARITETDYKVLKCYEYSLCGKELPYDIAKLHEERQSLRDEINRIESEL